MHVYLKSEQNVKGANYAELCSISRPIACLFGKSLYNSAMGRKRFGTPKGLAILIFVGACSKGNSVLKHNVVFSSLV